MFSWLLYQEGGVGSKSRSRRQEAVAVGQVRPTMAGQVRMELEWCRENWEIEFRIHFGDRADR